MSDQGVERSRVESEAAEWFARLSRRAVSTATLRDFRAWRRAEANAAAYAQVERTWEAAGKLALNPEIRAATAAALERRPLRPTVTWSLPGTRAVIAFFAALAVFGGGAVTWLHYNPEDAYTTKVGEQRLVALADGSRLRLNTDSRVVVRYRAQERRVVLKRGEAFFEVAHDTQRPFVVEAADTAVRALGTRFDVRRDADSLRVTLVEGRVSVQHEHDAKPAVLTPNQQVTVTARGISAARPTDAAKTTSWTTGRLTFHETALADAIAEVNRYATDKITLASPDLAAEPVNGVFDAGDTEAFVAAVRTLFDLKAEPAPGGGIRLVPDRSADG